MVDKSLGADVNLPSPFCTHPLSPPPPTYNVEPTCPENCSHFNIILFWGSGLCSSLRRGRSTDSFPEQWLVIEPNISLDQKDAKIYIVNPYKINDMPMLDSSIIWTHLVLTLWCLRQKGSTVPPLGWHFYQWDTPYTVCDDSLVVEISKQILTARDKRDTDTDYQSNSPHRVTLVKTAKRITEQPLHKMPRETLFSYIWQTHRIRNIIIPSWKKQYFKVKLQLLNSTC